MTRVGGEASPPPHSVAKRNIETGGVNLDHLVRLLPIAGRGLLVALVVVSPAIVGCVSPGPSMEAPVATALSTGGASPLQPSPSASALPGNSPVSTSGIEDFGASTPLFSDTFDDAESGWGTGSTPGGDVQYVDSALQFQAAGSGNWIWSYRPLESAQNIVHLEATFTPSAIGYQGLLCADTAEQFHGAVAKGDGRWVFIALTDTGAEVLTTGQDPAWAILPAAPTRMALDCAGTATGAFRMQLSLPDAGIAVQYDAAQDGPDAFDRVGLYGEASADGYTLRVDDLSALGGTSGAP